MRKRWWWGLGAAGLMGLGACAAGHATEGAEAATDGGRAPGRAGVVLGEGSLEWVSVEAVGPEPFTPSVGAPGRFELREAAISDVATQVAGRVVAVHVVPGDVVKAGEPIATLESPDAVMARFEVQSARAELEAARDALRRQQSMAERGVGLEVERAAARTRVLQAQTALSRAERAATLLGDGDGPTVVLRAPRDGTVLERAVTPGAWVGPDGGAVARVGDPDAVWFVAQVFERDLAQVRLGARVQIETTVGAKLDGTVARVSRVVDPETRRAAVYVEVEGERPRAGTWARVAIDTEERTSLVVPLEAVLLKGQGDSILYVEQGGALLARTVRLGARDGQRVEIVEGLAAGERVVKRGALLVDGQANQIL